MKKYLIILGVVGFMLPALAHANMEGVRINAFFMLDSFTECGAEVEVEAIQDGLINGTEALRVNKEVLADNSALSIQSGYAVEDRFLYLSASLAARFELKLELDYQGTIPDDQCQKLMDGDEIDFRGSFGQELSAFTLSDVMLNSAYFFNDNSYQHVDLTQNSLTINSLSDSWSIGTGDLFGSSGAGSTTGSTTGSGGNGTGCSLGLPVTGAGTMLPILLGMTSLLVWRRRQ